jgi:hypothetical protein
MFLRQHFSHITVNATFDLTILGLPHLPFFDPPGGQSSPEPGAQELGGGKMT